MEESTSTHACKINYDDFNNLSQRDAVKFRRSYGSVKLNPREGEETVAVDEFGVIIEKIQEVNEDVFLTRECNNFDLINLDSSHSLTSTRCAHLHPDLIERFNRGDNSKDATIHDNLIQCCSTIEQDINEAFDREPTKNYSRQIEEDKIYSGGVSGFNNVNSDRESRSHSSISDRKSDSFVEPYSDPTLTSMYSDNEKPCQQLMKTISYTQDPRKDCRDMKSVRFRDNGDVLTSINFSQNSSSSNDDKSIKCETEEMDSDDSSKWDKTMNDTTYNARYFYNSENHTIEQNATLRSDSIKSDLSEDGSSFLVNQLIVTKSETLSDAANCTGDAFLNDSFDNDSIDSQDSLLSASSAFESAMSSNDMMSPFGTPRNSLSKNSSLNGATTTKKKMGINFASLTSENIPNTLNRISMHKAVEKSILKIPSNNTDRNERVERDSNHNMTGNTKVYSSHSIRKLLTLTSQKKGVDKTSKKDCSNESQLFRKDSQKTISLKNRDKKLNLREFYSSRRNKLKSLVESEKLNHRIIFNSPDDMSESSYQNISIRSSKSVPVRTSKINSSYEGDEKEGFKDESKNIIPVTVSQSRGRNPRFISKIPRPVSRKDLRQKSEMSSNFEKCEEDKKQIYHSSATAHIINSEKSDKSETLSRPSDGSECSYKSATAKIKEEKTNYRNGSKLIVNTAQIDNLRSKYWMKEDKISFSSGGSTLAKREDKKVETIDKEKKKIKPHAYVAPQPVRQTSRLAYGKMVRVKTAPIKSSMQTRDKSIGKEPSRPDTAYSLKSGRKPSKVVSIGAVDVNKIL